MAVLKREAYDYSADIIQYLIDKGANPQERTWDYGGTIFHCAAALGSYNWERLVQTATGKKLNKKIFSQADNSSKKPLDLIEYRFRSQLPQVKQMMGDEAVTKDNWLVSLYFTTSKPIKGFTVDFGHAIIVFEGLDVSDDTPSKKHFNMIHLYNPKTGPSITTNMTKEEFDEKYKGFPGRNFLKWQVPAYLAKYALNKAI